MTVLLLSVCFVSCNSDDDNNDNGSSNYTWFSQSDVSYALWIVQNVSDKKSTTFKHNDLVPGYKIKFYANGTCSSTDGMETGWSLESGKVKTSYARTGEPMFVYTLISQSEDKLTVKIERTLDDDLSAILTVKKIVEQEYVDFGLPSGIKWATRNLGADYSKESGSPYKNGEDHGISLQKKNCSSIVQGSGTLKMANLGVRFQETASLLFFHVI